MAEERLRFFNPFADILITGHQLPHWQQAGATYFITFRLHDSVPAALRMKWIREREAWLLHHPYPWKPEVEREYHERFSQQMERWLDAGHGCCLLRDGEARAVVERTLQHFDDRRYLLHAWVLMPNHAHVLVSIREEWTLPQILHSWKSYSTHALNSLLRRQGALWQEDYFDRLIRDEEHFANCVRYIRRNPEKAHLPENEWSHHETVIARRSLRERK